MEKETSDQSLNPGISTTEGYLMPNPVYTYLSNIYDLIWLGFMAYQLL